MLDITRLTDSIKFLDIKNRLNLEYISIENRNLQQVAILTENEMRELCHLPSNQSGILISIMIAFTLTSGLAFFEMAFLPLITQADLLDG